MLLIFNLLQSGYYTTEPVASRYDAATMGMFVLIIVIGVIGYIVQARNTSSKNTPKCLSPADSPVRKSPKRCCATTRSTM